MTNGLFEETMRAFEDRMALRRKMLNVTGATQKKKRASKDVEDMIRDSILNCNGCDSERACRHWLRTAEPESSPPDFCPNHDVLRKLKSLNSASEAIK